MCGGRRPGGRVYLQSRVRFDINDDRRVCDDYWDLLDHWLRRGPSVRGRGSAASCLHLQRGLHFNVNDYKRVCVYFGHVFVVRRGPQLCWWSWATGRLCLQQWVFFSSGRCDHLRRGGC